MSLLDNLPHTCDILRPTIAQDALGGDYEASESAYLSDEPCWVQPASASKIIEFAKRDQVVTHRVFFNRNPSIRLTDKIRVTSGEYSGKTLTVATDADASAGMGILWEVYAEIDREG